MRIQINDRSTYRITERVYTDEGFLRVPGRVARTGIQEYLSSELGLPGNTIVRVYRPHEEVFNADSLASYDGADITIEHPDTGVNSDNYKKLSQGNVRGPGRQDNEFVLCDLIIKSKDAIDAVNSGKCELSAGYTAVYDDTPGVTPDGEPYDFTQRDIKINHVALVDRARAGSMARVFDNQGVHKMPVLITTDTGRAIDVADSANAQLVADAFDRLTKRVKDAEEEIEKKEEELEKMEAAKDAAEEEVEEEKKKSSDSAIKSRVEAIARIQTSAKRIAGESFACDSVDPIEIMRATMTIKRPKTAWGDKSAVYVQAAFDAEAEKEDEDLEKEKTTDSYRQLAADAAKTTIQAKVPSRVKAHDHMTNAWKKTAGQEK